MTDKQCASNAADKARTWPVSDHFDGKRFFNPTLPGGFAPTLWSVVKMLREPRSRWPRSVENKGASQLNATLARSGIAITFVNHATFLIKVGGVAILTDPVWSRRVSMFQWVGPRRVRKPGVALEELPMVDLILLSHNHYDHLDVATLRGLRQAFSPSIVFAAGDARLVASLGFKDMHELDWWG
jgi:glyoxylase-like metal-dependent hydrolase (beta-lactamase superfamily II)